MQGAELCRGKTLRIRLICNKMMKNHVGGWLGEDELFKLYTKMEKPQGWQQSQKENRVKSH